MIYLLIVLGIIIVGTVAYLENKRYNEVKPSDAVKTKIINVPLIEWKNLGGKFLVLQKHLVKCSDGSVMLPDIDQTRYSLGEIRFEEAYEENGVVKGHAVSTGIIYWLFGIFFALMNLGRKRKVKIEKKELPTNMYLQLIKDDGSYVWLNITGVMKKDYNEIYMNFR